MIDDLEINIALRQYLVVPKIDFFRDDYLDIRVVKYDHLLHQKGDLLDLGACDR